MVKEYKLVNVEKAADRTKEAEDLINRWAQAGWEVAQYSVAAFKGVMQPGFRHLILFVRESPIKQNQSEASVAGSIGDEKVEQPQ